MPEVLRDLEMAVPQKAIFAAILDFESYPKFLPEVVGVKVDDKKNGKFIVDFELEIMKRFQYSLEFEVSEPFEVRWKLLKSNFFKTNEGKWTLKQVSPQKTHVTYQLNLAMGFLVPGWVVKKLTEVNLPQMFASYEKQAKTIAESS